MKNKGKGLGRGIDALFQDLQGLEEVDIKTEKVVELPLNELRPNPYQPRKTFDELSLQELANSIQHSGSFNQSSCGNHPSKAMRSLRVNAGFEHPN